MKNKRQKNWLRQILKDVHKFQVNYRVNYYWLKKIKQCLHPRPHCSSPQPLYGKNKK